MFRSTQLGDQLLNSADQLLEPLLSMLMPFTMSIDLILRQIDAAHIATDSAARGLVRPHTLIVQLPPMTVNGPEDLDAVDGGTPPSDAPARFKNGS